jgi:hypothetical protein
MACTVNAEDGLQVLKQAEDTMGSISFSAKCDSQDGDVKLKTSVIQRKMEGQFEFRKEVVVGMRGIVLTNLYLLNENGIWLIMHDKVLRMDFLTMPKKSAFVGLLEKGLDTSIEADYDTESKQINGREIIVVSQKPRPLLDGLSSKRAQIVENKILIGRSDHMLYGYYSKRSDGTVFQMTVKEFTLLDKTSDETFEPPIGLPEKVCSTSGQYADIVSEENHDLASSPAIRDAVKKFDEKNGKSHYIVLLLMLIPTIFFAWFLLRGKFKI